MVGGAPVQGAVYGCGHVAPHLLRAVWSERWLAWLALASDWSQRLPLK